MDGQGWLTDYRRRVQTVGARAERAGAELMAIEATAGSRDGSVTVTVEASGALRRLVFGERAEGLSRAQLATAVLATARQAHELARRETDAVTGAYLREIGHAGTTR